MGYWDPPEYFDEAKFPEIDAETDTLIDCSRPDTTVCRRKMDCY